CEIGGLVEGLAVDDEAACSVATSHAISFDADHTFDQVLGACVGEYANELEGLADRASLTRDGIGEPAARIFEDDHLSPLGRTQLFDDDPVVDLQGSLHGNR